MFKSMFKHDKMNVFELVLTTVVSVAIGISFWAWTFIYEFAKPFLKIFGLKYLASGYWLFASIFLPYIIRRPGAALLASLVASMIEAMLTKWGLMNLIWGLVQGLSAEIIFALFRYRVWNYLTLSLAILNCVIFSYALNFVFYDYGALPIELNIIQFVSYFISGLAFAVWPTVWVTRKLIRTGLLNQFEVVRGKN